MGSVRVSIARALWIRANRLPGVRWGSFRRLAPQSQLFGFDRGTPVDRHYIEAFLARHQDDVRGTVLEVGDRKYTLRFGHGKVTTSDVLYPETGNPETTVVGDLQTGMGIDHDRFDCVILTQTLPFIYDARAAVRHVFASLRRGGVVLATVPGISQVSRFDMNRWGDYWRFTDASALRLFAEEFGDDNVQVVTYGNVLTATAFLHGLAAEELRPNELDQVDTDYQVIIGIRAQKS
jgi:hypothetical protein